MRRTRIRPFAWVVVVIIVVVVAVAVVAIAVVAVAVVAVAVVVAVLMSVLLLLVLPSLFDVNILAAAIGINLFGAPQNIPTLILSNLSPKTGFQLYRR